MKKRKNNDPKKSGLQNVAKYSGLAFEMLGIIVLGTLGGHKLDQLFEKQFPLWTVVLSLASVFISLYLVLNDLLKNGPKTK
jgi:hypothetical protein